MARSPTHRVTVSHYTETGDTVSDGAGGTTAVTEWDAVVSHVAARFSDGTSATEGAEQTVAGPVEVDEPRVRFDARDVGTLSWVVDDATGDRYAEYACDIGAGDDWQVTVHGHDGDATWQITDVREHYDRGPAPAAVVAVLKQI